MFRSLLLCLLFLFNVSYVYAQAKASLAQEDVGVCNPLRFSTTRTDGTLTTAMASTGSSLLPDCSGNKVLLIPPGTTWAINNNLTIAARFALHIPAGASVTIANGVTLTLGSVPICDMPHACILNVGTGVLVFSSAVPTLSAGSFLTSGCLPAVPTTSLTLDTFACSGTIAVSDRWPIPVVQTTTTVGPLNGGNGTYWLLLHRDTTSTVTNWTRHGSTLFMWQKSADRPTTPAAGVIFASITVAGSVITAVTDLRIPESFARYKRYSVTDALYGTADPTGVADSTDAFNAAVLSGHPVFVPEGTYSVSDIVVRDNMSIEGASDGRMNRTTLLVRTNNTAAFRHSSSSNLSHIHISRLIIRAGPGITGAKGYRQDDLAIYTAWAMFEFIETWADLAIAYQGSFILTRWVDVRDGFFGTVPGGQNHQSITSLPTFGGYSQSNLNQVVRSSFYKGTAGAAAMIDIAYGENWRFDSAHFEDMDSPAVRIRGIYVGVFESCWFEQIRANDMIILGESTGGNVQGSRPWEIRNSYVNLDGFNGTAMITLTGNSTISVNNIAVTGIPANVVLISAAPYSIPQVTQVYALGGAGAAGFLTGVVTLEDQTRATQAFNASQNMLPFGPSNLSEANFTYIQYISHANVASQISLTGNAIKLGMSAFGNAMYYDLPTKLVTFLRGKTVTFVVIGYGVDAGTLDYWYTRIWDSIPAAYLTGTPGTFVDVRDTALGLSYVTIEVSASASSLSIGVDVGGLNTTKFIQIEAMALYVGGGLIPTSLATR